MSIDSFKSIVGKRGGLAKANRFITIFTPPSQSLLNLNPIDIVGRVANDTFNARSLISDPRDIAFLCESTQMPGRNLNTLDFAAEKETLKIPNGFIDDDVTMTFLLTNDFYMKDMMEGWMSSIIDTENYVAGYKKNYQTDIVIQQLNNNDKNVYGIKLLNAYPINIAAIELNNTSEGTIQRVTVTFAYDRYVPENFIESSISGLVSAIPNSFRGLLPSAVSNGVKTFETIRSLL
jgi:hypothetical protein|tara:strand:- start:681 stop:1382 length:702 start_codon:yes stop_codon:yes gene_type:complete